MLNVTQLRLAAREIFDETLRAVDAGEAVRRTLRLEGSRLTVRDAIFDLGNRHVYSIAIGKAALPMALALGDVIGERLTRGLVVGPVRAPLARSTPEACVPPWRWCEGGHPLPNETSLAAAEEAFALLDCANEDRALLIFLVSGGGSAMLEWPIHEDIKLADLRMANEVLVRCGASIGEINSVRRAFSAVKGGRLAARAPNCDQITLMILDVPKGQEWNVASGPTVPPHPDAPDARDVVARYNLRAQLPQSIIQAIDNAESSDVSSDAAREHFVFLDSGDALEAAAQVARRRGFIAEIASDICDQPIEEGCALLLKTMEALRAKHCASERVVALISGRAFACQVKGDGIGGRNLETALRLACSVDFISSDAVALSAGTDGIDGNSPAAGALVDSTTLERAKAIGLDANDFLRRSDSYSFFVALGDAIATGPTGTNVRDIRILLGATQNRPR